MARSYVPPEYNEAVMCPVCGEDSDVILDLYGIIGGGMGRYTCCALCGMVVTKSFDGEEKKPEIIDGEFTNVEEDKGRSDSSD